ncbi:hypothetical protein RSal33209_0387 [Renibacterium salmoninarum ATCC 33209]|uniref:Uncharacterized protein n=1 Tax=Renibacterium salmoninarum (strain ATCC 33209 / DSM 20767 / JCM 11484 / NBRC 15589 / NCIMB 2235) TaxID=288705 RepID=A9WLW1_RENSM|nr:hypothetical protein [Renibacterium salmoninarum]ABY22142.1 hypothetical protein RSal33209_0387 [Renibacterium salmoninarum ATCC 33209]
MALFERFRTAKRDDAELGQGVWRRAHDRFRRGLDRFHQMLEGVQDEQLHEELAPIANELADLLPRVRSLCRRAHTASPSDGLNIPAGSFAAIHRELTRAGNALATAAEAVAMVRLEELAPDAVVRRAAQVVEHVIAAEALMPTDNS